jgi:hypothetical protein
MKLLEGLEGRGYLDNFFYSVFLFNDLTPKGLYTIGTIRSNRIGIPSYLKNIKTWKRCEHRYINWAIHESRGLSCVMWKDKYLVLLISTHALSIGFLCVPHNEVPHRNRTVRENIPTSPMLLEYTTFMKGIDVADQLCASCFSLTQNYKWWHKIFFVMLDMTEVNMYIIYLSHCGKGPNLVAQPMTHFEFKNALYETLLQGWTGRNKPENEELTNHLTIYMPSYTHLKQLCCM